MVRVCRDGVSSHPLHSVLLFPMAITQTLVAHCCSALLPLVHCPSPPSLQVQYYGLIKQVTGEDWEDAKISLSTAQPSVGGSAPPLPTKIIRFKRPRPRPVPSFNAAYSKAPVGYLASTRKRRIVMEVQKDYHA